MRYDQRDKVNESRRPEQLEREAASSESLFSHYVPEVFRAARPVEGKIAKVKMAERLERVKAVTAIPIRRRIRVKQSVANPIRN